MLLLAKQSKVKTGEGKASYMPIRYSDNKIRALN